MKLSKNELFNCHAGGAGGVIAGVVSLIISFFVGVIDGYLRKLKCNY